MDKSGLQECMMGRGAKIFFLSPIFEKYKTAEDMSEELRKALPDMDEMRKLLTDDGDILNINNYQEHTLCLKKTHIK